MAYDLQDLYALPPRDLYLPDLVEHRSRLEAQLMAVAEQLPPEQGMMIEAYIELWSFNPSNGRSNSAKAVQKERRCSLKEYLPVCCFQLISFSLVEPSLAVGLSK